jgi:hypothetical protein
MTYDRIGHEARVSLVCGAGRSEWGRTNSLGTYGRWWGKKGDPHGAGYPAGA